MTALGPKLISFAILGLVAIDAFVIPELAKYSTVVPDQDGNLPTATLIQKYAYRGETHHVTTEDGYILEMHRITGPRSNPSPKGKQQILVMHGVVSSSADWIITGPDRAFGYLLADEGYDVWLGNNRGNTYSRNHTRWSLSDKEFWQYSWHEVGCNDLPAMIDHILEQTNRSQLIYAGHSQGTTSFWVMASERPEYQEKVKVMFALAPVAYLSHMRSPFYQVLARFGNSLQLLMSLLGYYEFQPSNKFVQALEESACAEGSWSEPICLNIIFLIAGYGSDQLNKTMLPAILGHVPAGASVKEIVHFSQLISSGQFRQYDHGYIGNLMKYKRFTPPNYDLSKIKVPVSLHYSENDLFADPTDVDRLYKELGNPIGKFRVPHEEFTHVDFTWAYEGRRLVYDKIVGMMEKYRD